MKIRLALISAAAVVLAGLGAPAANAVLGGAADGSDHPNVGAVLNPEPFSDGTWSVCSGSLISPTVFLTAAHCDPAMMGYDTGGLATVTFDSQYVAGQSQTYTGTFIGDPEWRRAHSDPHDIAVIVFDQPVAGITPVTLPAAGALDKLPQGTSVVGVGYGANQMFVGPGHGYSWDDSRNAATGTANTVTPTWLKISENAARGNGGGCFGDSGGPNFINGVQVSITLSGDHNCRSINASYRLDTDSARGFLGGFITLP